MSSFDISDDEFNIDDSEFAVVRPAGQAQPPAQPGQSVSQRILAQRQQQNEAETRTEAGFQTLRMETRPQHMQSQAAQQQQQQQQPQQFQQQQYQQQQYQQQQQPEQCEDDQDQYTSARWQATRVESKFDHRELNSIKGQTKQTVMSGHKTQETNRISMAAVTDQAESTKLGAETVNMIRAMKQAQSAPPEPPPRPEAGFLGKIKKLFGNKE
jgi:hypothetical protein